LASGLRKEILAEENHLEEAIRERAAAPQTEETYAVAVEKGSLESEKFSENIKYSVSLSGLVDERWSRAFHIAQLDSTGFFLYRLEPTYRIVTFQVASDASPARVARLVERLERLVEDVNRSAPLWVPAD
jgi:hypothetical protein